MLDGLTPEQFDEWLAYREVEPDPLERLIEILKLGFVAVCASWGMHIRPEDIDPMAANSPGQEVTPTQGAQLVTGYLGPARRRGHGNGDR